MEHVCVWKGAGQHAGGSENCPAMETKSPSRRSFVILEWCAPRPFLNKRQRPSVPSRVTPPPSHHVTKPSPPSLSTILINLSTLCSWPLLDNSALPGSDSFFPKDLDEISNSHIPANSRAPWQSSVSKHVLACSTRRYKCKLWLYFTAPWYPVVSTITPLHTPPPFRSMQSLIAVIF